MDHADHRSSTPATRRRWWVAALTVVAFLALAQGARKAWRYATNPGPPSWSIGVYTGPDPLHTRPAPGVEQPVLRGRDVTDRRAAYVADPFMIPHDGTWYLFFEVRDTVADHGVIGSATSTDGLHWRYRGIVLDEPFHMSYPCVFEHDGVFYMTPESREAGGIRLYRATDFPDRWELVKEIVHGDFADPCIVFHEGRVWLFAVQGRYSLAIHHADSLDGPFRPHAGSPFYARDRGRTRPGGRPIVRDGKIVRFSQDNRGGYGRQTRAFLIDKLTPTEFEEHVLEPDPLLAPDGTGWRSAGMHTYDPWQLPDGSWIAVVDGKNYPESGRVATAPDSEGR